MSEDFISDRIRVLVQKAHDAFHQLLENNASPYDQDTDGWPITSGVVEWARPQTLRRGRDSYWVGEIAYSYSINGTYYAGFYHVAASGEAEAKAVIVGWKGRAITVRYSPQDPSVSVMQPFA